MKVEKVGNKVVNWELEVENKEVKWKVGNKEGNKGSVHFSFSSSCKTFSA
jgi:hypothetical protein